MKVTHALQGKRLLRHVGADLTVLVQRLQSVQRGTGGMLLARELASFVQRCREH